MVQTIEEMKAKLKKMIPKMEMTEDEEGNKIKSIYLGSYMSLDPCGKYHCIISENDVKEECQEYWQNLEIAAMNVGGDIASGYGDPTDIYFQIYIGDENTEAVE